MVKLGAHNVTIAGSSPALPTKFNRKGKTMTQTTDCPRGFDTCAPLQNLLSNQDGPQSFICCGYNDGSKRSVAGDRFTLCWKNGAVDEIGHWDRRDILDTMAMMATALSIDENMRVATGMSEAEMNTRAMAVFLGQDEGKPQ